MTPKFFLFRFDGAEANAEFVDRWQQLHGGEVYSGTSITVGLWTPDFLEVVLGDGHDGVRMTLIELEQTEKRARESCRQYLPESSAAVVSAFAKYLDAVLDECRRRTDKRLEAFRQLKSALQSTDGTVVRTAGALRNSRDLLEVFPLRDQRDQSPVFPDVPSTSHEPTFTFDGEQLLVRKDLDVLRRVVRILHAVLTGADHDGGTLDGFSTRNPLKRAIEVESNEHLELSRLVTRNDKTGRRINCGQLTRDLAAVLVAAGQQVDATQVRHWIEQLHPVASRFAKQDRMQLVFEHARSVLRPRGAV